ncbi:hypothetical protein EV426DRAFT_579175 [Tirmania nivea]|nr:hypothetical protein EV426DRAFT_579175 [Tirmania nivea]
MSSGSSFDSSSQLSTYSNLRPWTYRGIPAPTSMRQSRYGDRLIRHLDPSQIGERNPNYDSERSGRGSSINQHTSDDENWLLGISQVDGFIQEHQDHGTATVPRPRTDVPNSSPESLNAEYDCDRIIQWYIGTAKLYIQAYAFTRKLWPMRNEVEQMVDWAWTKAIGYHDKRTNMEMPLPAIGNLENKLAREILKRRVIAARGYLVSACHKNIDHLYDLKMEDPTAVRERVQELVDQDNDRFAATELLDVRGKSPAYSQVYFDREDVLGRHALTWKYFQPLTWVTISLTTTALLCTLHNLRNGSAMLGLPVLFDSTIYKVSVNSPIYKGAAISGVMVPSAQLAIPTTLEMIVKIWDYLELCRLRETIAQSDHHHQVEWKNELNSPREAQVAACRLQEGESSLVSRPVYTRNHPMDQQPVARKRGKPSSQIGIPRHATSIATKNAQFISSTTQITTEQNAEVEYITHNAGDNEAGSDNEDDLDLSLEEGSSNENWLITQEHALDLIMTEEDE